VPGIIYVSGLHQTPLAIPSDIWTCANLAARSCSSTATSRAETSFICDVEVASMDLGSTTRSRRGRSIGFAVGQDRGVPDRTDHRQPQLDDDPAQADERMRTMTASADVRDVIEHLMFSVEGAAVATSH
jgi:hypothetical protein